MKRLYDDEPPAISRHFSSQQSRADGTRQLTRKMVKIFEFEKNITKLIKKNPSSYLTGSRRHPKDRVAGLPF